MPLELCICVAVGAHWSQCGQDPVLLAIEAMHDNMGPASLLLLMEVVAWFVKTYGSTMTFATMCSGSDLCIHVLQMLSDFWRGLKALCGLYHPSRHGSPCQGSRRYAQGCGSGQKTFGPNLD